MARRETRATVVNRQALDAIRRGFVEGMAEQGRAVIADTNPPDDDPIGQGLVAEGDWGVWADGKKVAGTARKPRGANVKTGVTLLAGYPFPARFNEIGTVHQPGRPFFTPTVLRDLPGIAESHFRRPVRLALRRA